MEDEFKIYVDRLKHGEVETIDERLDPSFLEQNDNELKFKHKVDFKGEAYIVEKELVLHLNIETIAEVPCSICNEPVEAPLELKGIYHIVPLAEIKSGIFNLKEFLRETIILEAPRFLECRGSCPKRKDFEGYLKKEEQAESDDGYRPFSQL